MTTTLRPAAPEDSGPGGTRSRRYTVCVNSRPVGELRLATDVRFGAAVGRITDLRIAGPDRGRGRATVAALAAEEVLRGWDCRRVEVTVPETAPAALRLAAALGYTERNRAMRKELPPTPPDLPPGSRPRPMDEDDFVAWHAWEREHYVASWTRHGVPPEQARAKAEADHRVLLPDGPRTAHTVLRVLVHDGADVGHLWLRLPATPDTDAWVFFVDVPEDHRGHGHGRTLMHLAERECLTAGVRSLALNVFTGNTPAERLYESLGYRTTQRTLTKPLL